MPAVIVATPGASNANSFLTLAEANAYYDTRIPVPEWENFSGDNSALVIMATRLMVSMYSPSRKLVRMQPPEDSYYLVKPTWTGAVATTTQSLPWPRTGMYDRNGNAIASNVIPQDLKDATAELAIQLAKGDRTFDSDAYVQGLKSVQAGSVSLSFRDSFDATKIIPDIVFDMLVPSWLTDEIMEEAGSGIAEFDVVSE